MCVWSIQLQSSHLCGLYLRNHLLSPICCYYYFTFVVWCGLPVWLCLYLHGHTHTFLSVSVCTCIHDITMWWSVGNFGNWFSPFTMWVLGIKLGSSVLTADTSTCWAILTAFVGLFLLFFFLEKGTHSLSVPHTYYIAKDVFELSVSWLCFSIIGFQR